jgi:hypothetical protein
MEHRTSLVTGVLALLLIVMFALPDLYIDYKTGNSSDPIRTFHLNHVHYLTILNAARHSGEPVPNSYLHEQQDVPSHYELLQLIAARTPFFKDLSIALTWTLLRIGIALAYFALLAIMLKDVGIPLFISRLVAFATVAVFGFIGLQGAALWTWYLPFLLLGMYAGSRALEAGITIKRRLWLLVAMLALFSWHAISFSLGGLAGLLLWGYLIKMVPQAERKTCVYATMLWLAFSALIFSWLYAPFLFSHSDTAVSTIGRVIQFDKTYFLYHPIETVVVLASTLALLITRRYGYAAFGLAALVGLNSNLITGFYFANDHYIILTEALAVIAAGSAWISRDALKQRKGLGILAVVSGVWYLYSALGTLGFNPAFMGRYAIPGLTLFFIAALVFFQEKVERIIGDYRRGLIVALIILPVLYTGTLIYKGVSYPLEKQEEALKVTPLVNYLREHEYAVVLANSETSSYIPLYTPDRIYWSEMLWTDIIEDEEILHRWLVSRAFFPNDVLANGPFAVDSVYGAEIRCRHYRQFERPLFGPFADSWIARLPEKIQRCVTVDEDRKKKEEELNSLREEFVKEVRTSGFSPKYRLDLLVVSPGDQTPKAVLDRYFTFLEKAGDYTIYKFNK